MQKKTKNYWPHTIIIMLIGCVVACGVTIKIALDNPVEMDSFYLKSYHDVDANINQIQKNQKEFEENYEIEYSIESTKINEDFYFPIKIKNKNSGHYEEIADIKLLLTRPETNANNIEFNNNKAQNEAFMFGPLKVEKKGRWQILTKINLDNKEGFFNYEIFASN